MIKRWISVLCLILGPIWVHAQVVPLDLGLREKPIGPYTSMTRWTLDRPRLGLALSGGGARGLAQIGVLQELERQAIPVDYIAGTSMGAVIGGLYAVGYSAAEIESVAVAFRWDELIRNTPPRQQVFLSRKDASERHLFELHFHNLHLELPSALSSGQQLTSLLTQLVYGAPTPPFTRFDDFPIPFRAVATDLITGEKVVLSSGSLVDAMRASMAIPLLFTPMAYNGHQLVDGGLVDNLPVEEVRRMGADKVIAVDTSSPLHGAEALETPWIVADQATTIMMQRQRHRSMALADTVLCPELGTLANTDFSDAATIIESGRQAGRPLAQSLDHWLLSQPLGALQNDTANRLILNGLNDADAALALTLMGLDTLALTPASRLIPALQRLAVLGEYCRIEADLDTLAQTWCVHLKANPTIQSIHFEGNRCFPDSTLLERLDLQLPGPLNTLALQSGVDRVLRLYREQGYCLAQIDTLWFERGQLNLGIDEGKIERIDLMGVRNTRPYVILREIPFKPGKRLRSAKLTQAMEQIYSTGYFDEVRLSTNPGQKDHHLLFTIKEKNHGIFRMGMRYDTDRKLAGFLEVGRDNFLGFGVQSAVTALAGHQDLDLAFRLWSDRLFYSYTPFSLELRTGRHKDGYYRNFEEIGRYETAIQSACFSSGQQMGRLGTVSVRLTAEHAEIAPISGSESPSSDLRILSLGIRSEVDTRDQKAFTHKGIHHILDYESTGRLLGSNTGYTRLESLFESFFSTQRFWTFHPRLHWGTSDLTTPFHKQFKLGGPLSFPALPENALRGRRFVALCTEVILHLPPLFWRIEPHLSIRGDVAGAWEHYDAIKTDDFLRSLTFTLGSETLLGPFILGYSLMENRNHYLFFSLGHRFALR